MSVTIREARFQDHHHHILYDPALLPEPSAACFDPDDWLQQAACTPVGAGRGTAWFVGPQPHAWVLRRYRRGGLPGKLIRDHYWHSSLALSRPWREFRISARLYALGLPVPRPVAACLTRHGLTDTGALITCRIPDAQSLGERMLAGGLTPSDWQAVGQTIARLHREQVWHAGLNVHNLLCDPQDIWHIIDLDRARFRRGHFWRAGNLQRLRRSVDKLRKQAPDAGFTENDWAALIHGHTEAL